jgi:GT2 family glycosyltransferase
MNPVAFPAVFISRRAIDRVGNFDCSFCHCQDWNLWWRIAKTGPVAYSNRCIAAYREFKGNHTSSLLRTGKHFDEMLEQSARQPLVCPISLHPFVMGRPYRIRQLRRAFQHILRARERIWLTRPRDICAHIEGLPPGVVPGS